MKWFNDLNTMQKLLGGFGILLALTGVVGYQGMRVAISLRGSIVQLYTRDVIGLTAVKDVEIDKALIARCSRNAILALGKEEDVAAQKKEFGSLLAKLNADLTIAEDNETDPAVMAELKSIRAMLPEYEKSAREVISKVEEHQGEQAKSALKAASGGIIKRLNGAVGKVGVDKQKNVAEAKRQAIEQFQQALRDMLCTLFATMGIGLVLAFSLSRSFSRPLTATVDLLKHVASGDLSRKLDVKTKGEIGMMAGALNEALDSMSATLLSVRAASSELTSVSTELAKSALALSSGTQEQSASLEETSASLEQINVTLRQSCDHANEANALASSSRQSAESGGEVLMAAVNAMHEIDTAAKAISSIVVTIDEITFQTNLLAVNASIEAANAGEYGRGFSVVATEVRTLAQRSARAAQDIRALIENSLQKVNIGCGLVNTSGETFLEIIANVKSVSGVVGEIAAGAREQSVGIDQVTLAMNQIDKVTQGNNQQTERLSETASLIAAQAANLEHLVGQFVISANR